MNGRLNGPQILALGPDIYTYSGLNHLWWVPRVGTLGTYPGHLPKVRIYPGYPTQGRFQPTLGRVNALSTYPG